MKKNEFRTEVRKRLNQIPLEERKAWDNTDLYIWWNKAKKDDPYLTWDKCPGQVWQWIPGMCNDLIGSKAI